MKTNMTQYVLLTVLGLAIVASGIIILVVVPDAEGILKTLPFVCIGIGSGLFGGSLSNVVRGNIARKNPQVSKQVEIEEKDERNIAISDHSKAKAYDLMLIVFAALAVAFALAQAPLYVVLSLVAAYLFVVAAMIYYLSKYHKEM